MRYTSRLIALEGMPAIKEWSVSIHREPRDDDSRQGLAGTDPSAAMQRGLEEILTWLEARLVRRGAEAGREKDRDGRGQRNILGWLETDAYIFEQKFRTLAEIFPGVAESRELSVVGSRLQALISQCHAILLLGEAASDDFPARESRSRAAFEGLLEVDRAISVTDAEIRQRFKLAGNAIRATARWIKNREYNV